MRSSQTQPGFARGEHMARHKKLSLEEIESTIRSLRCSEAGWKEYMSILRLMPGTWGRLCTNPHEFAESGEVVVADRRFNLFSLQELHEFECFLRDRISTLALRSFRIRGNGRGQFSPALSTACRALERVHKLSRCVKEHEEANYRRSQAYSNSAEGRRFREESGRFVAQIEPAGRITEADLSIVIGPSSLL
jgi:hypothetical protein